MQAPDIDYLRDEHTLNTLYVKEYERLLRSSDSEDPYVSEFGRMPERETFKHYME